MPAQISVLMATKPYVNSSPRTTNGFNIGSRTHSQLCPAPRRVPRCSRILAGPEKPSVNIDRPCRTHAKCDHSRRFLLYHVAYNRLDNFTWSRYFISKSMKAVLFADVNDSHTPFTKSHLLFVFYIAFSSPHRFRKECLNPKTSCPKYLCRLLWYMILGCSTPFHGRADGRSGDGRSGDGCSDPLPWSSSVDSFALPFFVSPAVVQSDPIRNGKRFLVAYSQYSQHSQVDSAEI